MVISMADDNQNVPREQNDIADYHEDNNADIDEDREVFFEPKNVLKQKPTSQCWNYFKFKGTKSKGPKGVDLKFAFCVLCLESKDERNKKDPAVAYCSSTTNLNQHLLRHHSQQLEEDKTKLKQALSEKQKSSNLITDYAIKSSSKVKKWSVGSVKWKQATERLAKWLVAESRPLKLVEDEGFRHFMEYLCPEYQVPSASTMSNYIDRLYEEEKEKLIKSLHEIEHVAITTDGGSSTNAVSFQDVNCHFVDENWELVSHTLAVQQNKEEHTAEKYREISDEILEEFEISPEKVALYVTDNENKMLCAYPGCERSGCCAHMIHSTWGKGVEDVTEVDEVIKHMRKVATFHNKSPKFRSMVEKEQEKAGLKVRPLIQDVATRWGSTKISSDSFLNHKDDKDKNRFANFEAINSVLKQLKEKEKSTKKKDKLKVMIFSKEDMVKIEYLNDFLIKLSAYSTNLGASSYVTSSIVLPTIKSIENHLEPSSSDVTLIADLKCAMLADWYTRKEMYINENVLKRSTALDPRFKDLKVIPKMDRQTVYDEIEAEMRVLISKDQKSASDDEEGDDDISDPDPKKAKMSLDFYESDDEEEGEENEDIVAKEIQKYLKEPKPDRDSEPLKWWKVKESTYPVLSRIAKKYLAIPATSVEAERRFSDLGNLLTKRRLSMTGANVNKQLFLKKKVKDLILKFDL